MRGKASLLLVCILFGAFILRLYRFSGPVADWHSWRQADTSAVSRNFVTKGYDILHPRFDDLSNVPSGKDNPQGYRFVEFPIYNLLQAGFFQIFGVLTIEEWGRLITIFSSLGAVVFLYLIVLQHISKRAGLLTAFFYAFIPYDIYYGRVILPDPSMVTAYLGAIYFFARWLELESRIKNLPIRGQAESRKKWVYFVLSLLFAAVSLLLKPYAIFFLLPIGVLALQKFGVKIILQWKLWLFAIVSVLPLVAWRLWMTQYPEGIPANAWLLNGNGIRFRPAFFRWMGYERVTKLISGYTGVVLLAIGTYDLLRKKQLFLLSFLVSSILYVCTFATGNVQHDYYQILIMPSLAIVCGIGGEYLLNLGKKRSGVWIVATGSLLAITVLMFFFAGKIVKDYFNINNPTIIVAGKFVDHVTPKDAKVIAVYDGDTSFLYQTKRQGWASLEKPLPEMVSMGADYLVLANPTQKDLYFSKDYKIIAHTNQYLLYDLHQKP